MGTSYSAPDIYHRIRGGRGSTGFSTNSSVTENQSSLQSSINDQVVALNGKMNSAWQGNAADQAVSGAAPLATAADTASSSLTSASKAMQNQVGAFHTAYNSVVEMSTTPPQNNLANEVVSALGVNTPLDQKITDYNTDGQHNVQVYKTYSSQSASNAAEMPTSFDTLPDPHPSVSVTGGGPSTVGGGSFTGTSMPANSGQLTTPPYRPPGSPGGGYQLPSSGPTGNSSFTPPGGGPTGNPAWEEFGTPPGTTAPTSVGPGPFGGGPGYPGEPGYPYGNGGFPPGEGYPGGFPPGEEGFPGGLPGEGGFPGGPGGAGGFADEDGYSGGRFGAGYGRGGFGGPGGFGSGGAGGGAPGTGSAATGGPGSTGAAQGAEEAAFGRGGGMLGADEPGNMGPMGAGRGAKGEEDKEHKTAEYLQEADPDALFGSDQLTVPPVIGAE